MTVTSSPFFSFEPPPLPAAALAEAKRITPSPGRHSSGPWHVLVHWLQENTFSPSWLPDPLRHPLIGYVLAGLLELAAAALMLLLTSAAPTFAFHGILVLVGVVLIAVGWGAGPSIFASLTGVLLLWLVVLPPHFSLRLPDPANGAGLVLAVLITIPISLLVGGSGRVSRRAEEAAQLLAQAAARSRFDAERLRTVLEVLPSAVLITNLQGQLLAMNQATTSLWGGDIPLGTSIMQSPGLKVRWARSGQPLTPDEWTLDRALSSGEAVLNEEFEIETLDGKRKTILSSAAPLRDEVGAVTAAVISAQDISDLRRLEQEADDRARELEAIFETMTDGVFVLDARGHSTHLNAAAREILGPEAAHLGHSVEERVAHRPLLDEEEQPLPVEQIPSVRILHGETLTGAQAVDVYFPTAEGRRQVFSVSGTPLRGADGNITGAVAVTRDVTERHWLEREVLERAQELEAIVGAVTDGIALLDGNGQLIRTNRAFRRLLGFEQHSEYLTLPYEQRQAAFNIRTGQGQPLTLPVPQSSAPLRGKTFTGVDLVLTNLDGREVVVNVDGVPLHDQQGQVAGYIEVYRDMTARHHMEQLTRETLAALVAMAEAMVQIRPATPSSDEADKADAVSTSAVAPDTALSLVARRLAELTRSVLGCRQVSIAAVDPTTGRLHPVTEVGLPPEQERSWWASWSSAQRLNERYGPAIAAMLYAGEATLLDVQHLPERSWYTLFGARSCRIVPMRLGEELVGILLVDYPEPDHDYSREEESLLTTTLAHLGTLVLERDQLLRGWAEAQANELALYETKAQMDTFLGIASHELKTPLTSLKLSLQLSQRQLRRLTAGTNGAAASSDARLHSAVEQVNRTVQQIDRMEALVNDLVDVSRIQAGRLELHVEQVDLAAIVRETVIEQREASPGREIHFQRLAEQSVPVYADAGRIEQVVTNFLTNALKYSPADRPVEVGVEAETRQARVWVRDQGPGLPPQEQEHIWERFHRAKGVEVQSGAGVGLGLGLYISRIIVERHRGQVGVDSTPGQGATFWFTLPLPPLEEDDH